MIEDSYSIHSILDGEDDFTMIEITQEQYDQYKMEADEVEMNVIEYIELAMNHELSAEEVVEPSEIVE